MSNTNHLELQAATLEEFLTLIERREHDEALRPPRYCPLPRRAVCVQTRTNQRVSPEDFGLPDRTRYVLATFAYGEDLVSFRSTTSRELEMGPPAEDTKKLGDAQQAEYRRIKAAIEQKLAELGIGGYVPIIEGRLIPAGTPANGPAGGGSGGST